MPRYVGFPIETDPNVFVRDSFDYLQDRIEGWSPSAGNLEVWLLEAIARMAAEERDVASSVPIAIFRFFGRSMMNILPVDGSPAIAFTTWTAIDDKGYTIPQGTVVGMRRVGDDLAAFRVFNSVVIPPGAFETSEGAVIVQSIELGAEFNELGAVDAPVELIDTLEFVSAITQTGPTSGGVDRESDDDYMDRLNGELRLMAPRPILPPDFAQLALRIPGVARALVIDLYNPHYNALTLNQASFESGTTGWGVGTNSTLGTSTSQFLDGGHSLTMTSVSGAFMTAETAPGATVQEHELWTMLASFRPAAASRSVLVALHWFDEDGAEISTDSDSMTTAPAGQWTQVSLSARAPVGATSVTAILSVGSSAAGEVWYVDNVSLHRGPSRTWSPGGTSEFDNERMIGIASIDVLGNAVSAEIRARIGEYLESLREQSFIVNTFDPTYTQFDVTFDVQSMVGSDPGLVQQGIVGALTAYLSPASFGMPTQRDLGDIPPGQWNNDSTVRYLELATVINNTAGVDYIKTNGLTFGVHGDTQGTDDIVMAGAAALPISGLIAGTVS